MNCSAHCDTPPRIEWKKDGTFLNLVSDDRRQLLPDGSLLINSVVHSKHNKPDEGYYQCVATVDSLGTIVSRTAKLTVAGRALLGECGWNTVMEGSSLPLEKREGAGSISCQGSCDCGSRFTGWELACVLFL
ncbi:hypothetical protein Nmel_013394 [Mimus melanotis]